MQISPQQLLVVEDDVTIARALSRTLARHGFSVAIARSCAAARSLTQRFDYAVLDLDLPDGNGVDLARDLLAKDRVPSVAFFTGSSDPALVARARRIGNVVMKSSGTSEILALLAQENLEAPESHTAPSNRACGFRAHSGVTTSAAGTAKSRAR
ncbi:MAG TPA: response regulator [Polyangiaceae bacterium]|jgi:DNA-binding response OmpR family regulator